MKGKKIFFLIFGLVILLVPIYVIMNSESILEKGHRHKLHLQGFDPFDPFRGKYLRLSYDDNVDGDEALKEGDKVYVTFVKDSLGFSQFDFAHKEKPDHDDYMTTTIVEPRFFWDTGEGNFTIKLDNLTKYFINENKAKEAEKIVMDYTRERPNDIYVAIRVLDGEARLEDIFVEEIPLLEFLEK